MTTFTIASWNIDSRADGLAQRIGALCELGADVVLLQEVPRRAEHLLEDAAGFAWAQMAVHRSEPTNGPATRLSTAILGTERVACLDVGQIPAARFVDAGLAAGLSEPEVHHRTGWRHRNLYADIEINGHALRVCSLHARPATGGHPGRPPLGYARQLFHRVCAAWIAEQSAAMVFGIDANGPYRDHPDPAKWQPAMAGDATLIGPAPAHHLTDALYRWLEHHPGELHRITAARPDGPLAISYRTAGERPCRYDHIYVTDDLGVEAVTYHQPGEHRSDHGLVVATLTMPDASERPPRPQSDA